MEIQLLGSFGLVSCTGRVDVGLAAQRVLALLAIDGGRVPRDVVAGRLWSDLPQGRAMANLRGVIWRLPDVAAHVVLRRGPTLELNVAAVDLHDVCAAARHLIRAAPPFVAASSVEDLLLDRDLLPGWREDWVVLERERLRQLRLHALEAIADAHLAAGAYDRAVCVGEMVVRLEPLRESAHMALIEAHVAHGNRAAAERQYRALATILRKRLRTAPTEATRRILHASPSALAPSVG